MQLVAAGLGIGESTAPAKLSSADLRSLLVDYGGAYTSVFVGLGRPSAHSPASLNFLY